MRCAFPALATAAFMLLGASTTPTLSAQDKGPATPTKLWAAQTSPTTVTLVWQLVAGAAQYNVFGPRPKSGNTGAGAELLARLGSTASRYVTQLAGAEAHHYFIQAVDAKGQVSQKAEFNPVVPPAKQPASSAVPAPSFLKAEVTGPGEVTLRWGAVPGATAYAIGRSVRPQGLGRLCELCPTETKYVDHDAVAGAIHLYRVIAITPQGTSRPVISNEVTPATGKESVASGDTAVSDSKDALPKAPSGLRAALVSPTSIQLSWGGGMGATVFQIKRKVGTTAAQLIGTVNATVSSFLDHLSGAVGGIVSYEVIAVNGKGAAEPARVTIDPAKASSDSAGPPPKAASGLKATVVSSTGIRVSWTPGLVGAMYRLSREVSGKTEVIATLPGSVANFLDHFRPGGMPGVINYWIEAVDGKAMASEKITVATGKEAADSLPSPTATATTPPSPPSDLKAAVTAPNTVTLTWTGMPGRYEVRRAMGGGMIKAIGQTVEGVFRFIDQLPPMPWAKSQSIVYIVVALGSGMAGGAAATTSKQASVTVTIDPQKAAATPPPAAAAADSAPEEGNTDSLPRPRGRVP